MIFSRTITSRPALVTLTVSFKKKAETTATMNFPESHSGLYSGNLSYTITEQPEVWMSCDRSGSGIFPYAYQLQLQWWPAWDMPSGWQIGDYVPPAIAGGSDPNAPMWMDLGFEWKSC